MNSDYVIEFLGSSQLLEQHRTLEEGLDELVRLTADLLQVRRCSIMLLTAGDEAREPRLRVYSHHGYLPDVALKESMPLYEGIAGHVARSGKSLWLQDVADSQFVALARGEGYSSPSLICVPIRVSKDLIGVINVSDPQQRQGLTKEHLDLAEVFSMFVGQSIHTFQLQRLVESRVLQMAMLQERRERAGMPSKPISPDPARLAKLVAKNFYRELTNAGFGPNAVIAVASEVLSMLNSTLAKHKERRERQASYEERGQRI